MQVFLTSCQTIYQSKDDGKQEGSSEVIHCYNNSSDLHLQICRSQTVAVLNADTVQWRW